VDASLRGSVNGLAMTIGSIAKAIGPAAAGSIYAWSLTNSLSFPFDVYFIFIVISISSVLLIWAAYKIPNALNYAKDAQVTT